MLSGKGFKKVYNLSGGIKNWEQEIAIGPQEKGLDLFSGHVSAEDSIVIGFGLEEGLREFYLTMKTKVPGKIGKSLFEKLADIEILHQKRLVELYRNLTGTEVTLEDFIKEKVQPAMEGGLTTEEYLQLYNPNVESEQDIIGLALAIEAQAFDLYQRAADHADSHKASEVLRQIANEERTHIAHLTGYLDTIL